MNWGTRIVILYLSFAALIATLVVMSVRQRIELVSPTYYEEEINYQQDIDAMNRANALTEPLEIGYIDGAVAVAFPQRFHGRALDGEIVFRKPDDSSLDRRVPVQPDTAGVQRVPRAQLAFGSYTVKVSWKMDGLNYLVEKEISLP